jgi:malate synthase
MKTASLSTASFANVNGLSIKAPFNAAYENILTADALAFLVQLHRRFNPLLKNLLNERADVQQKIDNGWKPAFDVNTKDIRETAWQVSKAPRDLQDRRVEITGPVERKMIINALNSGARVFMADLEDSNAPGWDNVMQGQVNLKDAVRRTISYTNEATGKAYTLNTRIATLMVRPRGLHLTENHIVIDESPASASLVDFGLYFFHNAISLMQRGSAPYFYLPKLESYKEAKFWNEVFLFAQSYIGIPAGTIKATVLIETILASFQMHEILWELRAHSAGLNCGRWDYIFSFIKKFKKIPGHIFPDRSQVTMTVPFMRAYTQLLIKTCHQRAAHAIGGMAAQIPVKDNPAANAAALAKVKADKLREVTDGHDGTWVAHPGLVNVAMEVFDEYMTTPNQLHIKRQDFSCAAEALLSIPEGTITEEGVRANINVAILYIESWLRGTGAVAIHNLMEDAATAEICRTQVWQWLHNKVKLADGRTFNQDLYEIFRDEEIERIRETVGCLQYQQGAFVQAICLFNKLVVQDHFEEFLTLPAYNLLIANNTKILALEEQKKISEAGFEATVREAV